jgi:excinuclease ABC subunit C
MALRNAKEELIIREGKTREHERAMFELSQLLGIADLESIEIYDISHQSGTDVVCGMAVYGRRGFLKDRYKKFRIAADANDDCGCMNEAAYRRFKRYKDGDESFAPLPSAVFADGALPQVRAVRQALNELGLYLPIFGLKKDSRHRTKSLVFEDGREVMLYKYPQIFPLCGRMQEEAHRFAITYHSAAARRRSLESMFTAVEGIGKARANAILKHFKTLSAIKAASVEELAQVKGMSLATAQKLYDWMRAQCP